MPTHREDVLPPTSPQDSISEEGSFHSQYKVLRTIGQGSNGKVLLARHRLTGTHVAIKVLVKNNQLFQPAMMEAHIMRKINHPNIISLLQVIETKTTVYLIMELVEGQELYQYIKQSGYIEEDKAREIFKQIISAVSYCHAHGIVHRDLKPDNIMLDYKGKVKIIDFGLSTQVEPGQMLDRPCGAYSFGAPELFLGEIYDGTKNDIWTLGVVLYYMVVGKVPFDSLIIQELQRQVVTGVYPAPCGVSEELEDLISCLLTVNPSYRPTVMDVMMHPWFKEDWKAFPNPYEELILIRPDHAIVEAMQSIGFQAKDIIESLIKRKYNCTMASYFLLQGQALQGHGCSAQAQPVSPVTAPFPTLETAAAFHLGLRRSGSAPILGTLTSSLYKAQESAYAQEAIQRRGRRSTGPGLLFTPLRMTRPQDQHNIRAMSVPCIHSTTIISERSSSNENREENLLSHSSSAEDKPISSSGRPRGFKGWTKRIGNAMRKLFCCFQPRNKPRLGQKRVSPQK
ncbi:sperm motility kinase Y-like [Arvicanthis niloticus]|uniref:sperm motility kinase Y-like n=1 Tax=Arvicanthis niloticus TaxID=61156 RepID=UPI0014868E9E|nr:sperm motility kinase Y-like [Arvicanthis niloticus]